MKKILLYITLVLAGIGSVEAQGKKPKAQTAKKPANTVQTPVINTPVSLNNWAQYNAKNAGSRTLSINDPTVITLNRRANGENVAFDSKEILGVPKITYGLGNGQLLFRSRGATTSGTGTGSGTVGTGSSTGPLGMNGLALGVNGKSPYAGPIMDGIIVTNLPKGTSQELPRRSKKKDRY